MGRRMILSTAQLVLGVALLLAAPIFWAFINSDDPFRL